MRSVLRMLLALGAGVLAAPAGAAEPPLHHEISVSVYPDSGRITATDRITLPQQSVAAGERAVSFQLHPALEPRSSTPGVQIGRESGFAVLTEGSRPVRPEVYRVNLPSGVRTFTVEYGGQIYHPLSAEENYARGFRQTPGLISNEGVFLSDETVWYPEFGDDPFTFSLEVVLPPGWSSVSQGRRALHEVGPSGVRSRWESPEPQREIYLVAGRYSEYRRPGEPVEVEVFLRSPDEALAGKYLETGAQYLAMYSRLLGPYPYPKFAVVENFWETGYGMPSFTLLGSKVIRFPFILHSSYPHEILHNWWGNGVYVDYASGNWCEGLTAYLADHLIQEDRGAGAEYRQETLQKYAAYVSRDRDFPLVGFRARHSSASEAVGYGKALMFFHMLRLRLGDGAFVRALRSFYESFRFRTASYDDLRRAFEKASGADLSAEFAQWVTRPGAPTLALEDVSARGLGREWILSLRILQMQPSEAYHLRLPVAVTLEGRETAHQVVLPMDSRRLDAELTVPSRPLRVDVDPEFDVFRRLDPMEIPPALSGAFGAERVVAVLPEGAPPELRAGYRELAESWAKSQEGQWEIVSDADLETLPADRAVWLFGWENKLRKDLETALAPYDVKVQESGVTWGRRELPRKGHTVVLASRHPASPGLTLAWVAADDPAPLPGLGRKLPHYHKYSYLGFEGPEPANVIKGRWPVVGSPLTAVVPGRHGPRAAVERAALEPRKALASLSPEFSRKRMAETVRRLASTEYEGRGFGGQGLDRAAELIAEQFRGAGLAPGADGGTYYQTWKAKGGEPEQEAELRNILAIIPGNRPEWEGQSVVVGAHYDHLGFGWPGARAEDRGKLHPGADDNASGVAVLLELARVLGSGWHPERTVVFAAFTGEEAGRLGSRRYVESETRYPASRAIGMINLDTVVRLGNGKLLVLGTGTAQEWVHIFNGAGLVAGVRVEPVEKDAGGSDQVSFVEAGVPAVQLFTGPHLDYHRPSDTAEKVDVDGLVKVAQVAREAIEYLAGRAEPLTATATGEASGAGRPGFEGRKVSLGTVPDFTYEGPGVRLAGVSPGSPAEKAGLRAGDIITRFGSTPVQTLRDLSKALKAHRAGDRLPVTFLRESVEQTAEAVLKGW